MHMSDSNELPEGEAPVTSTEDRLGRFLEEAMNVEQRGQCIDVAALLADRPDLIDRGRRLVQGLQSFSRAAATTTFPPAWPGHEVPLPNPFPGEFRIRRPLGEGTFGKVWLADDLGLDRQVALKTLHLPADADPSALAALGKEAKILANLDHRNVVKVHAWRQAGGEHYLVLEYVAGGSLADLLKEGPVSWPRAARYIANVAEGLVAVHAPAARTLPEADDEWESWRKRRWQTRAYRSLSNAASCFCQSGKLCGASSSAPSTRNRVVTAATTRTAPHATSAAESTLRPLARHW
jgi:hypothetical protein